MCATSTLAPTTNFIGSRFFFFFLLKCVSRVQKKSYLDQRRARYEKQFRMTHDYKLSPIVIWYVFYRRLSSLMTIQAHSQCVCVLCTVYALRQFLLIGRHEHSPLTAALHSEHNKYTLTLKLRHTQAFTTIPPSQKGANAKPSVCDTTTIYS